ncbi:MAG: hydroxymethylglutaryl-CoA reductase [Steroidobacteraceae bacterium]|nr:hydroxymethylglutaryl-CoA reductase [Nevskiaceae bacterium]MCP5471465.1 hydroxymethylglutaryl-CoA reductase [Nevskiaceae bacterium]
MNTAGRDDDPCSQTDATRRARRLPATTDMSSVALQLRRQRLRDEGFTLDSLAGTTPALAPEALAGSIEGFIGYACVPVGIAGPVRIRGAQAEGEYFLPFATTEGTLVASFQHAFNVINRCGGAAALVSEQQVGRAPCFEFADLHQADAFARWLPAQRDGLAAAVATTSRYCRLLGLHTSILGNTVYVRFEFTTGDAAGQNMVTLATQVGCQWLLERTPIKPRSWLVESVLSGDKRASALAFRDTRGRNASAEVVLPAKVIARYWRTDVDGFVRCWAQAQAGSAQTGAVGLQANVANALAAMFIACGQDVACIAEAVVAVTRAERRSDGDLYVSVTLPNLIVGTVGGGTYLPTAQECLSLLGCTGTGKAAKFAEIVAVAALAGELAILGAMASGQFAAAHAAGGRKGRLPPSLSAAPSTVGPPPSPTD